MGFIGLYLTGQAVSQDSRVAARHLSFPQFCGGRNQGDSYWAWLLEWLTTGEKTTTSTDKLKVAPVVNKFTDFNTNLMVTIGETLRGSRNLEGRNNTYSLLCNIDDSLCYTSETKTL